MDPKALIPARHPFSFSTFCTPLLSLPKVKVCYMLCSVPMTPASFDPSRGKEVWHDFRCSTSSIRSPLLHALREVPRHGAGQQQRSQSCPCPDACRPLCILPPHKSSGNHAHTLVSCVLPFQPCMLMFLRVFIKKEDTLQDTISVAIGHILLRRSH